MVKAEHRLRDAAQRPVFLQKLLIKLSFTNVNLQNQFQAFLRIKKKTKSEFKELWFEKKIRTSKG